MNIFTKIKNFNYKQKNKKYRKFKNCSIPYPFYDKKRNTLEWVRYISDADLYDVSSSLQEAFPSNITYHFKAKLYGREKPEQELEYRLMISHCHNFDDVVKNLYDYPQTFEIPEEFKNEYSNQELIYLKQLKDYLLLIGLKDYRNSKERELLNSNWDFINKKKYKNLKDKLFMVKYQKKVEKTIENEKLERYKNSKATKLSYQAYLNDSNHNR